ncbi:glycosyltransferase family 4 protein [Natrinema thermotolerans]|uniref:Glycosyltransferase family 4 protein n=1 Tax=Natrinema thermotolerans TaxID=121872 RepID=A0AAF0PAD6_9EURY|nr:glycosyltransferase family 4 protein [Natrinema thermotolerans]QCC60450.1 glycosyltransferase family 1 protein [Natrinema thermotolerans]QCC61353.1 glycosyltransferase family 1 protein [Natrinema thermotolerans]WMT07482.1 glycosyltransferase family 4 protein [Natrinema thermotolerans]WMT08114.1 glycosyltransferase family 4 protein [Natrinema thermotolerans]
MNTAFISNVVFPFVKGGAEKRIHEIGRRLAAEGHEITVYGRQFWDGPQVIDYEGVTLYGVASAAELYADDRRSITEAIDFSTRLLPHLRRNIDDHDLVVASLFPYFPVLASKLVTLGTETPLVTTWHEVWLDHWDEYLGHLAPFGKAIERLTANTPHYPIAVSGVTADRLTEIGPARDRIEVVPNGLDVTQIETTEPAAEGFDVLYAGRLAEHKNVDLLLEAFDQIADTRPDATLGVIGDGPERDALEARAQTLEHADRITMLGFLEEYDDVLAHMRAADVFASPSTREGFGITFAEAMAADCTVIAADHPESAASEVIANAGFLTPPAVDDLASVLERALAGDRPATDPTARARRYDWDSVAEQAEACYRRAIDGTW